MPITITEAVAIEQYVYKVTLPIFLQRGELSHLIATGTLFKIENRHFLVTARHVFDGLPDLINLAYPENYKRGALFTLGSFTILKPDDKNVDVAVIELLSIDTIERLEAKWNFLTLSNISIASSSSEDEAFFVSGFPHALTKFEDGWTTGKLATVYTQRLPNIPFEAEKPIVENLDIFFDYGLEASLISGVAFSTPKLPGFSGASVWERKEVSGFWSPETAISVVAVQSAYVHSKYIRATSWCAVANVLIKTDQNLAKIVSERMKDFMQVNHPGQLDFQ